MCWDNDGEACLLELDSGTRRARKPHRCEAGCPIQPRDTYHYWVGIFEGDFSVGKACAPCMAAARALGDACRLYDKWSDNPPIYELREAYSEHLEHGELPRDVVPAAVVRKLQRHYRELKKRVAA